MARLSSRRPRRSRSLLAGTLLIFAALLAAACGGDDDDTGANSATGATGTAEGSGAAGGDAADVARAKEQAKSFRTLGMPDDWINFGAFYTSVCDTYSLSCTGSGSGPNRNDTDMSSAEEIAAFKSEKDNPAVCADIGIAFGQVAEAEGAVLSYLPAAAKDLPASYKAQDGGWVASAVGVISILTNTSVVPNPPKSFADLLKPEYQGKVSISNPESSGTGQATVFSTAAALSGKKGSFDLDAAMDYWKTFNSSGQKNQADFSSASFERGETPIRLAYDFVNLQTAKQVEGKGIKAEVAIPAEGGVWSPSATMCNGSTDKADLAKLVLDHTLSPEGQLTFAEVGARPVLYTLGKLDVPAELKTNWLPDAQYANVVQYPDEQWPEPAIVAERWEKDVLSS